MHKIASSYAKALLQLAAEQDILERIQTDMHLLHKQFAEKQILLHALCNPTVTHDKKLALLQDVFEQKVHPIVLKLFVLVAQRHREALLPVIAQEFLTQYDQRKGITKARVTTTFPLSEQLIAQFKQAIQQIVPCEEVLLDHHLDPALIGGYVLRVEDKQLDQSLRSKLNNLKKHYMTGGY